MDYRYHQHVHVSDSGHLEMSYGDFSSPIWCQETERNHANDVIWSKMPDWFGVPTPNRVNKVQSLVFAWKTLFFISMHSRGNNARYTVNAVFTVQFTLWRHEHCSYVWDDVIVFIPGLWIARKIARQNTEHVVVQLADSWHRRKLVADWAIMDGCGGSRPGKYKASSSCEIWIFLSQGRKRLSANHVGNNVRSARQSDVMACMHQMCSKIWQRQSRMRHSRKNQGAPRHWEVILDRDGCCHRMQTWHGPEIWSKWTKSGPGLVLDAPCVGTAGWLDWNAMSKYRIIR